MTIGFPLPINSTGMGKLAQDTSDLHCQGSSQDAGFLDGTYQYLSTFICRSLSPWSPPPVGWLSPLFILIPRGESHLPVITQTAMPPPCSFLRLNCYGFIPGHSRMGRKAVVVPPLVNSDASEILRRIGQAEQGGSSPTSINYFRKVN